MVSRMIARVAIIPARAGSKRIKNKNITPFFGKSIIEWSIGIAKRTCELVAVSSDSEDILDISERAGAIAIAREERLSRDDTPTLPVVRQAILDLKRYSRPQLRKTKACYEIDLEKTKVMCLYPTAVLAQEGEILKAFSKLDCDRLSYDYVVSIHKNQKIWRSFVLKNGLIEFIRNEFAKTRTQDLPEAYVDAGQFYIGYAKSFVMGRPLLGERSLGLEVEVAQDIDTLEDLEIAKAKFAQMLKLNEDKMGFYEN